MLNNLRIVFPTKASAMTRRLSRRRCIKPYQVIRDSLVLYDFLHKETLKGNKVVITGRNEKIIKDIEFK